MRVSWWSLSRLLFWFHIFFNHKRQCVSHLVREQRAANVKQKEKAAEDQGVCLLTFCLTRHYRNLVVVVNSCHLALHCNFCLARSSALCVISIVQFVNICSKILVSTAVSLWRYFAPCSHCISVFWQPGISLKALKRASVVSNGTCSTTTFSLISSRGETLLL